jgi:hypothetical protein
MGPINQLIWIDQANGILLGIALFGKMIFILTPLPFDEIFGSQFCDWSDLPGCTYLVGSFIWSSLIAIYRVIYIKAQNWIKNVVGEKRLLRIFMGIAFSFYIPASLWLAMYDYRSSSEIMCYRRSNEETLILLTYQVILQSISN